MEYLILLGVMIGVPAQSVIVKSYQRRNRTASDILFTAFIGLSAMLVFVGAALAKGGISLSPEVLPYSLAFAVGYGMAFVFQILALSCGPMSLTVLIISYSLLIPTFYGVLFLRESVGTFFVPGVLLLAVCLFLINYQKRAKKTEEQNKPKPTGISLKWLIFVWLSFLGNGLCSTVQKIASQSLGEEVRNEFMVAAMLMIAVGFLIAGFIRERRTVREFMRRGWYFGALCGFINGVVNLACLILAARMPASIQYPLISAGSILFSLLFSVIIFKEKITPRQYAGVAVGVLSIVFLNLP